MQARDHWIEIDVRRSAGLEVGLFWRPADGATAVSVHDAGRGESFARLVPSRRAADAFRHPYAYREIARMRGSSLRRTRAFGAVPASGAPDVDELWLSELAAEVLASIQELLERGGDGPRGHGGV